MERSRIGIIISTIREGRFGDKPAQWILDIASERSDLDFDFLNRGAEATLDELAWWTRTLKAGRVEEAEAAEVAR
jgi:hypothetical protein